MKIIKYILAFASFASLNVAMAQEVLLAKPVNLPFSNKQIITKSSQGLTFAYDLTGTPTKKIICKFNNAYKAWLSIPNSPTIGGNHTIIISSKDQTLDRDENTSVVHTDNLTGSITVDDTDNGQISTVSCSIENEQ